MMFGRIGGLYRPICEQMILTSQFFVMNLSETLSLNQFSDSL